MIIATLENINAKLSDRNYRAFDVGDMVEEWTLKGSYIENANFGDFDWGTSDPAEIVLSLKYDYAILQF